MINIFKKKTSRTTRRPLARQQRPTRTMQRAKREARFRIMKMVAVIAIPMVIVTLAYPYINAMMNVVKPDLVTNCYSSLPDQNYTASVIDYSTTNLFADPAQMNAMKTSYMEAYTLMSPNQRFDVFTTAKDTSIGIASPIYSVCKPASTAAEYAAMKQHEPNMSDLSQAQLTYQAKKAKEEFAKKIDELIAQSQAKKRSEDWDAPLFQTFKSVSRYYHARGDRIEHLMIYSAGIVASQNSFWCKNRNDLPSWPNFKKRLLYRNVKPFKSFEGMRVTFLMPNILVHYRQGKWCNVQEIQDFWRGYFVEAKAQEVDMQPLDYRPATVKRGEKSQQKGEG